MIFCFLKEYSISNTNYFVEYQGTFSFAAWSFSGYPSDFSSYSMTRYLKMCLFRNLSFEYGFIDS